jgi:DNA uptake protein ComE-like DNA-binding protein
MTRFITFACIAAAVLVGALTLAEPARAQVGKSVTIVDANAATEADLAALPHMNAARAKTLVARRPFNSMPALDMFLTSQGLTRPQMTELYGRTFVPINLNTATREEILLIPNAGERMVREFLEYRPYKALAQFHREIGKYVDEKELARLEQYVFVPINLNTASDADILTIPGLGARMLREFKEYRPYKAMEQFRREMGKYVSKEEVARLERYVTIN